MWDAMRACCCWGRLERRRNLGRTRRNKATPKKTRPRTIERSGIMMALLLVRAPDDAGAAMKDVGAL